MASVAPENALREGDSLDWYRIERVIGRGGFGVTYLAHDTNLDRPVAIKEYLPDSISVRDADKSVRPRTDDDEKTFSWGLGRFVDEARTLARFSHPNIVRVMSVFERNDTAYMVMSYEEGQDLRRALESGVVANDQATLTAIVAPILEGLSQVHQLGFIHRDIKPSNIYIRDDGSAVLLDFGSARLATVQDETVLTSMISAGYSPIEQYAQGDATDDQQGPWTDIYSLGAVLYYAITGRPPADAMRRSAALIGGRADPYVPIASAAGEAAGGYRRGFLDAIDRALALRAADRPRSLVRWRSDLLDDERTMLSSVPFATRPPGTTPPRSAAGGADAPDPATSAAGTVRKAFAALALAILVAVLGAVGWLATGDGVDEPVASDVATADAGSAAAATAVASGADADVDVVIPWIAPTDAPTIDGLMDRIWTFARYHDSEDDLLAIDNLMIGDDPARGDGDTEYKWAAMHDGEFLYLYVFGEHHETATPWFDSDALWADDNLNVFLDGDNSKATRYDGVDDFQVMIPLLKRADEPLANNSTDADGRFLAGDNSIPLADGFLFATCFCEESQYGWELRLDIAGAGIELGERFGIEIQIDDDLDGGGRDAKWGWRHPSRRGEDLDMTWRNPSFMGTAVLKRPPRS